MSAEISFLKVSISDSTSCLDGYAYFAPTIIRSLGHSPIKTQLYSVPPWVVSFGTSMIIAVFSDWFRKRYVFIVIALAMTLIGHAILISIHNNVDAMYAALFLTVAGTFSAMPVVVCWFGTNGKSLFRELLATMLD